MALVGVVGSAGSVNFILLKESCGELPSLFIDCSNCANPHLLNGIADESDMQSVFVLQAESMYRFSAVLKELEGIILELCVRRIIISSFDRLFNFQNEAENRAMNRNLWDNIREISDRSNADLIVGINEKSEEHLGLAQRRCDVIVSEKYYGRGEG